jgi:pimeloyl-ACP methyl ester carboxylesterase
MAKRSLGKSILVWTGRIVAGLVGLVVLVVLGGAGWEMFSRNKARHDFPPVGQLVDVGAGRRIHIDCRGQGSPTVVFEAGLDTNGSLAWDAVHDQVATFTRACAYDRAGVFWSDPKPGPHDADRVADDLHAALAAAGEKAPFVLVGHSLGGPYIVDYTRKFPDQVAGLVFVDASHPDQIAKERALGLPGANKPLADGIKLASDISWTGATRILLNQQQETTHNIPPRTGQEMRAFGAQGIPAAYAEAKAIEDTFSEAGKLRNLGDRPIVVLTAGKVPPAATLKEAGWTEAQYLRFRDTWIALQNDEASWSTHSRHTLVTDSTHYIQFERPDLVIAAVKDVVTDVRAEKK